MRRAVPLQLLADRDHYEQVTKSVMLEDGGRFRLGGATVLECHLARDEPQAQAEAARTVLVPADERDAVGKAQLDEEGEPVEVGPHTQFLLDEPEFAWYVVSGGIDIQLVPPDCAV